MTRRALLAACALAALAVPQALAATARNGAPIDPRNLIADDLEAEALASYARNAGKAPFKGHEIVVVDYRLPSSARRLYIVDLDTGAVEPHFSLILRPFGSLPIWMISAPSSHKAAGATL